MKQEYYINEKDEDSFWKIVDKLDNDYSKLIEQENLFHSKIVKFAIDIKGNNYKNAVYLHKLRDAVLRDKKFSSKYIYDESHIYFCEKLYSKLAKLEELLRTIVVLVYKHNNEPIPKDFDKSSLYDYFSFLIYDKTFNHEVRNLFNGKSLYAKDELINIITDIPHNPSLQRANLSSSDLNIIDNFKNIKKWRNNIAHFKNFKLDDYKKADELFDDYIGDLEKLYNKFIAKEVYTGLSLLMTNNAKVLAESYKTILEAIQPSLNQTLKFLADYTSDFIRPNTTNTL